MKPALQALGRLPAGTMNKTEKAYAAFLDTLMACGDVIWWKFEGYKFRLADKTFYSPDFAVMRATGHLEMHEVKGGIWEGDARVKIKVAASEYPHQFIAVQALPKAKGGGWKVETF
jgi:hypothetical protein